MKNRIMLAIMSLIVISSLFSSCTIKGEKVCGVWNATSEAGEMKLEITPWDGKFIAYLLEYKNGNEISKGGKSDEHIFLTDLVYKDGNYVDGTIYVDQQAKESCGIRLEMIDNNQLKAIYNCQGGMMEEICTREGSLKSTTTNISEEKDSEITPEAAIVEAEQKPDVITDNHSIKSENKKENTLSKTTTKKENTSTKKDVKNTSNNNSIEGTIKKSSFYVIGVHRTINYDDMNGMAKAVEDLWNETYNNDFSGKLNNISDMERMYVAYTDYDNPKGKMTITIGYKVKDLSNIPAGLKGVKIPSNDFLSYAISGEASDYEGEGWGQLEELMMYRKPTSADFEIYEFDANYNVKKASLWIATK